MKKYNKQKIACRTTINGTEITNVALSKSGIPLLDDSMKFYTVGRTSGSVKVRGVEMLLKIKWFLLRLEVKFGRLAERLF